MATLRFLVGAVVLICCAGLCVAIPPNYTYPTNITYIAFVRDVRVSHQDFEAYTNRHKGAVAEITDSARHPILTRHDTNGNYTFAQVSSYVTDNYNAFQGKEWFDSWYYDIPMVNIRFPLQITLSQVSGQPAGTYSIDYTGSNRFFPINGRGWGNDNQRVWGGALNSGGDPTLNFGFTFETHSVFEYRGTEVFSFSGDDDVWVFINNKLILDLGGAHSQVSATVNLTLIASAVGLQVGGSYNFDFYLAERHSTESNFKITTTIVPSREAPTVFSDTFVVQVGSTLNAPLRFYDAYMLPQTFYLVSIDNPSLGTLSLSNDTGTFTFVGTTNGTVTFSFMSHDGYLYSTNMGNITISTYYVPTPPPPTPGDPPTTVQTGLSAASIAGIVVGSVIGAAAVAGFIILACYLKKKSKQWEEEIDSEYFNDVPINPLYVDQYKGQDNPLFDPQSGM